MLKEDFENSLQSKLEDASIQPSPNGWDKLQAQLPAEQKPKAAVFFGSNNTRIFVLIIGALLCTAGLWLAKPWEQTSKQSEKNIPREQANPTTPLSNLQPISPDYNHEVNSSSTPTKPASQQRKNTTAHLQRMAPFVATLPNPNNFAASGSPIQQASEENNSSSYFTSNIKEPRNIEQLSLYENKSPRRWGIIAVQMDVSNAQNMPAMISDDDLPTRDKKDTIYKFIVGTNTFLMGTYRNLRANSNATSEQKAQVVLRNKIEYTNTDFNGGLFLKYHLRKNWYIGTGININNMSERINFASKSNTPDKYAPAITLDADFKRNNMNNSNVFKMGGDSVYQGLAGADKMYTLINHYYFNEIPVHISYMKFKKVYNWYVESGVSLNKLTVINASLVDLDQVGFTGVIDKVNYKGISSYMFNFNLAGGLSYNINQTFSIGLSAQFKYAINPLINFGYAKQNPYSIGAGLVFAKRF